MAPKTTSAMRNVRVKSRVYRRQACASTLRALNVTPGPLAAARCWKASPLTLPTIGNIAVRLESI